MFLTVHAAAGITVAGFTNNIIIAFILGILSHFILDIIPHGDEKIIDWSNKSVYVKKMINIALIDSLIAVLMIGTILKQVILTDGVVLIAGAIGGMLPDLFGGWAIVKPNRFVEPFQRWHFFNHGLLEKEVLFKYGFVVQFIFLILLVYPLLTKA